MSEEPKKHRWSGWPGAWCLDCGTPDQYEYCMIDHYAMVDCKKCTKETSSQCESCCGTGATFEFCKECSDIMASCPAKLIE